MARASDWRITWDPLGTAPRVLLDHDDPMDGEMTLDGGIVVDAGRFDFARSVSPTSRGNRRRRLGFTRRRLHDSAADSWHACAAELAAGPWGGEVGTLQIQPRAGSPVLLRAALASSEHQPVADFSLPESVHSWSFRCTRIPLVAGDGITIIGGWYNPRPGGGPGGDDIDVIVPGGSGVTPGGTVHVGGVPGIPPGYYPVIGVVVGGAGGGSQDVLRIRAPHDQESESIPQLSFEHGVGTSTTHASAYRLVSVTSAVPFEVWGISSGVWQWWSRAAGSYTFGSESLFGDHYLPAPYDIAGRWAGLSSSNSPVDVTYTRNSTTFMWRRIGGPAVQVPVLLRAEGSVTHNNGIGGNRRLPLPPVQVNITAASAGGWFGISGGGTITPVAEA